ncbi:penicillin acylase family protein [Rubrivirga sp. S365]|uniref:penicillin acylase family protein n=1 Tax=Rubrivirga sp. S365 TaxID=3076080 RepID=UPI0028C664DA|nr:penicillin acylase family protein [Rubrivirga sp. S365]MDT7857795.1 penicillin acylase family protein [Rubrivirga sp. S365]
MTRVFVFLGLALALLAGLVAATVALAYGTEPAREGTLRLDGLSGPVTVAWSDSGGVFVEAQTEADLAAGLGYAHAVDHAWAMTLWRQAARGGLAEWFGGSNRALDLHARALGFADLAQQTYAALPPEQQAVLDAYARGASRGLADPGVAQSDAFLAGGVVPEPWRPWDALAVERLHAYLASSPLRLDSARADSADAARWAAAASDSAVVRFAAADSAFRTFLGAPSQAGGRVYAATSGGAATLASQVSAGSSALPLLAPAVLRVGSRVAVAATIPGTLVSPAGWSGGLGWGLLLGSDLRLEPYGGPAPAPVFSRVVDRAGNETLLEVARDTSGLVLRAGRSAAPRRPATQDTAASGAAGRGGETPGLTTPPTASPLASPDGAAADSAAADSTAPSGWRVRWRGFRPGTDLGAFAALRAGRVPDAFALFAREGLVATRAETRVLGRPVVAASGLGYALVARDSLARYAADRLARLVGRPAPPRPDAEAPPGGAPAAQRLTPEDLAEDAVSPWAARLNARLLAALGDRDSLGLALQVPYSYLRSWDGGYRADAIGPSVFEWWLVAHRDYTGHLPDPADSLDAALLPYTLRIARAELRDRYGTLPTEWRWGHLLGDGPRFPVLGGRGGVAARSYAEPLPFPGGHPTALVPGPSLVFERAHPPLAVWTVWSRLDDGRTFVRTPAGRPAASGVLDVGADAGGFVVALDPRAAMPARRLVLSPPR